MKTFENQIESGSSGQPAESLECASPGCSHPVVEAWEKTGRYCPICAIEQELADRELRWSLNS